MATSSRRIPLASLANATNSPHRPLTNSGSKRPRSIANVSHQENEPPQKRLAMDKTNKDTHTATPRRQTNSQHPTMPEARVFERGNGESASNAFQRKLVAARDGPNPGMKVTKTLDPVHASKEESIRTWQKHYRKIFPTFSFYFDGLSDDARTRFVRQISSLGAKEEKFFSKAVTHIVTTRQIPSPARSVASGVEATHSTHLDDHQPQTIDPSLLKLRGPTASAARRDGANHMDILARGRDMGMKIWATEKLQRILGSIFEDAANLGHHPRGGNHASRSQHEDLGQVLKNEKLGTSSEREQPFMSLVTFKGPFVYIHDMDEKYRPTMVREYPKVAKRSDGEWPQFRSASMGKCPFVEDPAMKKEVEQERSRAKVAASRQQRETEQQQQGSRTRSTTCLETTKVLPPRRTSPRKALQVVHNGAHANMDVGADRGTKRPQPTQLERQSSFPPMPAQPAFEFIRPSQLTMPKEPAASGIQRSNLTSALQSNMISSTAATGVKAATSKEVHQLKRQVFKQPQAGSLSVGSIPSSHRMNDLAVGLKHARAPAPQRAAKSKAQEKLGGIQEEHDAIADNVVAEPVAQSQARRKTVRRDPKPGYCENCRDKYDDFEEHIVSRKHRKFAMTQSNWTELDALLEKLQSP
ncbi:hypothetical protein B0A52_02422 [Exophiala mesophila]|uniref:DBF4-type domain-containing protein n=1 Tax=Exophiala mesophila TaxID=212818 RepID=A0A438NCM6_EXOME|nr:hypothetical protein B0A52_02422 [Exophiala mesophila]